MFYITEILFRIGYLLLAIISLFSIFYYNKKTIVNVVLLPFIFNDTRSIGYFIYNHPTELVYSISVLFFLVALIMALPYAFWATIDFFKTGLHHSEYTIFSKNIIFLASLFIIMNVTAVLIFFPVFWHFFESWNSFENNNVQFYLELRFEDYFNYAVSFILILNFIITFFSVGLLIILRNGVLFMFKVKKFLILMNIVVATFLSPPEVFIQLLLFITLNFTLELLSLILIIQIKINRATC